MGIWLELGIFVLVLVFALWQMHDARTALERSRAARARAARQLPAEPDAAQAGPGVDHATDPRKSS